MKFKIQGVLGDGTKKNGMLSADSEDDALKKAKAAGIFVSNIEVVPENSARSSPPTLPAIPALVGTPSPTQVRPQHGKIVVSSGSICANYNVLGLVVGFASKTEGCGGAIPVENVYQSASKRLIESATAIGANGLIGVNFQNRVASQAGCTGGKQVFEVFAWGTAIQF